MYCIVRNCIEFRRQIRCAKFSLMIVHWMRNVCISVLCDSVDRQPLRMGVSQYLLITEQTTSCGKCPRKVPTVLLSWSHTRHTYVATYWQSYIYVSPVRCNTIQLLHFQLSSNPRLASGPAYAITGVFKGTEFSRQKYLPCYIMFPSLTIMYYTLMCNGCCGTPLLGRRATGEKGPVTKLQLGTYAL